MSFTDQMLLILGMSIVTYIPRAVPLMLLSSRKLPETLMRWLEMIPPSVLAALLASELFVRKEGDTVFLDISASNIYLLALPITMACGWLTNNFFVTIAVGMGSVALLRYFML